MSAQIVTDNNKFLTEGASFNIDKKVPLIHYYILKMKNIFPPKSPPKIHIQVTSLQKNK
jgi:hypothetical protein